MSNIVEFQRKSAPRRPSSMAPIGTTTNTLGKSGAPQETPPRGGSSPIEKVSAKRPGPVRKEAPFLRLVSSQDRLSD